MFVRARFFIYICFFFLSLPPSLSAKVLESLNYTPACDVWAIGVITYILLCGYPPFLDDDHSQLFKKIRAARVEFNPQFWGGISPQAKAAVQAMLTRDPAARPSARAMLDHAWFKANGVAGEGGVGDGGTRGEAAAAAGESESVAALKSWTARKNLKGGIKAVLAANRLS